MSDEEDAPITYQWGEQPQPKPRTITEALRSVPGGALINEARLGMRISEFQREIYAEPREAEYQHQPRLPYRDRDRRIVRVPRYEPVPLRAQRSVQDMMRPVAYFEVEISRQAQQMAAARGIPADWVTEAAAQMPEAPPVWVGSSFDYRHWISHGQEKHAITGQHNGRMLVWQMADHSRAIDVEWQIHQLDRAEILRVRWAEGRVPPATHLWPMLNRRLRSDQQVTSCEFCGVSWGGRRANGLPADTSREAADNWHCDRCGVSYVDGQYFGPGLPRGDRNYPRPDDLRDAQGYAFHQLRYNPHLSPTANRMADPLIDALGQGGKHG